MADEESQMTVLRAALKRATAERDDYKVRLAVLEESLSEAACELRRLRQSKTRPLVDVVHDLETDPRTPDWIKEKIEQMYGDCA